MVSSKFSNYGKGLAEDAGKMLAEAFGEQGDNKLVESFGITYKEAGQTTTSNAGSYANLLASTLYTAAIEKVDKILDLVEINEDLLNKGGFGAMQLPRLTPTIAYEVSEGAITNYFDEGIDAITVTAKKVVAGTSITWEIMKRGMTDFAKYVLKNAADAITRKLATDILGGLVAGSGHSATTGSVSFANILEAEKDVNTSTYSNGVSYGFIADGLVISTTYWSVFRSDEDVKATLYYAGAIPNQPINAAAMPLMFGNLEIVVTPFLTSAHAFVLEKKRNVLVKESNLETFEGQIPGRLYDREVIALMSYVMAILYPKSISYISA